MMMAGKDQLGFLHCNVGATSTSHVHLLNRPSRADPYAYVCRLHVQAWCHLDALHRMHTWNVNVLLLVSPSNLYVYLMP
jgi:hypothetical protein